MKKLLLTLSLILTLTIWCSVSMAQSPVYKWGLPQTIQTPVVLGPQAPIAATPFPDVRPQRHTVRHRSVHPASLPMPSIRKVRFPVCEPILMPAPPTPIYVSPSWPAHAVVDAKVLWQKASLSFHTDQLSLTNTNATGEFGVAIIDPKTAKIRYSFTMPQTTTETVNPTTALQIGATSLIAAQASVGQAAPVAAAAAAGVPIKIDWQVGPSHRIDAVCLRVNQFPTNFWLSPAIVANWMNFQITGTTTIAPITAATETFQNFYWGGGAELVYQQNNSRLSALVAGSDRYLMCDAALAVALGSNFDLTVGWQGKQVKMERDSTLRLTALALGLAVRF